MIGTLIAKRKVAAAFQALNRHDLAAFMSGWSEKGVFVYPGEVPASGTYTGKAAVEAWFRRFLEQFPVIEFQLQDVCARNGFDFVGNNVIASHWTRRMVNGAGFEVRDSGISLATAKLGKVVRVEDFFFDLGESFQRMWGAG